MRLALIALLAACASEPPPAQDAASTAPLLIPPLGTLYNCPTATGGEQQWCWNGPQAALPASCYPTPLQGPPAGGICSYRCPSDANCIAFNGCYCP